MHTIAARSRFNELIALGRPPIGTFITSTDAAATAAAAAAGCDFVIIDREHAPNEAQSTVGHIRAAEANDCIPIVRVLDATPSGIQQSLDLGAQGVMVPKIGTAEEARAAVLATRYARGGRGVCPVVEAARWDLAAWDSHKSTSNEEVILIPLIETQEGVDNLEEIMAVPGVDFVFFGFADLAEDAGLSMKTHLSRIVEIWDNAVRQAGAAGVRIGCTINRSGFSAADFAAVGPSDLSILFAAMRTAVDTGRETLGLA